jgi:hypothetical protein
MPNLMQLSEEVKSMPDAALQRELIQPSGVVPGYLLLAEVQRRQLMRQAAEKQMAGGQGQTSVYEDVLRNMMARQPPAGIAPAGMTPPSASAPPSPGATPPQNFSPPRMMAEGGEVDDGDDGGDDGGGDLSYDDLIDQAAQRYGERPEVLRSMMHVESNRNPRAVSKKGAVGLMQLMPSAASDYGVTDRTDPAQNIDAGAHLYHDLHQKYGDERTAAGAYWYGQGNMAKHGNQLSPGAEHYADLVERGVPGGFEDLTATALAPRTFTEPPPPSAGPPPDSGLATVMPDIPDMGELPGSLGPAPPATDVAAAASAPAAIPTAPAVPAAPAADFDTIAAQVNKRFPYDDSQARAETAALRAEYEKAAKPNLWRTLSDLGWGLAASRGPSWVMQLGQAGQHMAASQAAREEEWRKEQLQLLGVDLKLDEAARRHKDALAAITERAVTQTTNAQATAQARQLADQGRIMTSVLKGRTDVRHQLAGQDIPPGYERIADQEHPGWEYVAAPVQKKLTQGDVATMNGIGQTFAAHPEITPPVNADGTARDLSTLRLNDLPQTIQNEAQWRIRLAKDGWSTKNIEGILADPNAPAEMKSMAKSIQAGQATQAGAVTGARTKATVVTKQGLAEKQPAELNTAGQNQMREQSVIGSQFDDLINRLEPYKTDNNPATLLIPLGEYKLGRVTPQGQLGNEISNLSLASIQGMMPFATKSRNYQFIKDIRQHLPNLVGFPPDSPANIYDKLLKARRNFLRMDRSSMQFEQKHVTTNPAAPFLDEGRAHVYYRLAGGDPKKARDMAQEDGWQLPLPSQ